MGINAADGVLQGNTISKTFTQDDYRQGVYRPGKFQIELCGSVAGSLLQQEKCTFIMLELLDSCDPPSSLTCPDMSN